jgi:mono/diheme cytochrome c family protein
MFPSSFGRGVKPRPHIVGSAAALWAHGALWGRGFMPRLTLGLLLCCVLATAACRQDMHDQPKVEAYEQSDFFADGRGMREIPEGTVARGQLNEDQLLHTGKVNGELSDEMPFPATREVLERGRERFNVYCTPCHGLSGMGNGMVVQRGFRPPPSLHAEAQRSRPLGHYFDVMTNGFGAMPDYRAQVPPDDRWAIAAYIRALQLSQRATVNDVPADRRGELDNPPGDKPAAPAQQHGTGH